MAPSVRMGQTASAQREEFSTRNSRRFSQLVREREIRPTGRGTSTRPDTGTEETRSSPSNTRTYSREGSPSIQPFASLRRHISTQSSLSSGAPGIATRSNTLRDDVLYEQEERLLVNMEDSNVPHTSITHITASPMPRRPSMLARLGSRLLPRSTLGPAAVQEGGRRQRRRLHRQLSDSPPQRTTETRDNHNNHRFSMLGSLYPGSSSSRSSQRRPLAPISGPIPLVVDGAIPASALPVNSTRDSNSDHLRRSLRRSRLARVRQSMSDIESFFSSTPTQPSYDRQTQTPPRRPSRVAAADEIDYLLPPLSVTDTSIDLDETTMGSFRPNEQRHSETLASPPETSPIWSQRWADRTPTVRRDARRVPNLLRGRSSRLIRRDDEAPLSQILRLAAAAIAAQLSGTPEAVTDMDTIGDDGLDGSLNTFMETLNNAAATTGNGNEANRVLTTLPPLNFLRVFRFVNAGGDRRRPNASSSRSDSSRNAATAERDEEDDGSDGRTVTLVVVGVRSVPSVTITRDNAEGGEPNLDTLLNLPLVPSPTPMRSGPGGLLRHADGRPRFTRPRRASLGGVNPFPANYDSQRHQRMHGSGRPGSDDMASANAPTPIVLSESPPGPHPPPSTPDDPGLSAQASAATTPSRRPSSASAMHRSSVAHHESASQRPLGSSAPSAVELDATQPVRQRRRSDSEFARHRDLGAGAARRNGVVEPDNAPSQSRSWLIYVVGTNLSEDHPAFATPSLFTDVSTNLYQSCQLLCYRLLTSILDQNPTYEDMLLLSSLLGPAKPPVASQEDVATALGVHWLQDQNGILVAVALDEGEHRIQIAPGERCLVCLCEYEASDLVRQLTKCSHVFHRECIDVVSIVILLLLLRASTNVALC